VADLAMVAGLATVADAAWPVVAWVDASVVAVGPVPNTPMAGCPLTRRR
jgi:hypothetical protein